MLLTTQITFVIRWVLRRVILVKEVRRCLAKFKRGSFNIVFVDVLDHTSVLFCVLLGRVLVKLRQRLKGVDHVQPSFYFIKLGGWSEIALEFFEKTKLLFWPIKLGFLLFDEIKEVKVEVNQRTGDQFFDCFGSLRLYFLRGVGEPELGHHVTLISLQVYVACLYCEVRCLVNWSWRVVSFHLLFFYLVKINHDLRFYMFV